jgi:hypothetical protein
MATVVRATKDTHLEKILGRAQRIPKFNPDAEHIS